MIVWGVDCSTKKIAIFGLGGKKPLAIELISDKESAQERIDEMFLMINDYMNAVPVKERPSMIYVENAAYLQNVKTSFLIHQVVDAVHFTAMLHNTPNQTVEITSWKKDVLGNGRADKAMIMAWSKAKYGELITSQDLADASGICNYGYRRMEK